ncbi:MAG: SDR family oxidoreductase [Treponema sp.]|jgi:3-oxoacyl-[acyl-carrier protein] reductase|nr:SDR family oxidoreductase [Treponema sp.]
MGNFYGKQALIIGGTGGIGRAAALGLAGRGAVVTVTGGSSQKRLDAALAELTAGTVNAGRNPEKAGHSGFLCSIGGPEGLSPEKAAALILEKVPAPDILVLAWGPFKKIPLEKTNAGDWRYLIETNILFPGIMVSSVLHAMINKGWGRILLFGGTKTGEIRGFSSTAAYGTAKTALGTLAKSAAKNAGKAGVTCNVICPGLTDTEYSCPEEKIYHREQNPQGKALNPEEIARIVLEVLENPAINGAVIPVDGGVWI